MVKATFNILQPFGIDIQKIYNKIGNTTQLTLS